MLAFPEPPAEKRRKIARLLRLGLPAAQVVMHPGIRERILLFAVLLLAVDDQGRLYDDAETGSLASTEYELLTGEGPWELELIHILGGGFDLLCLDSAVGLSLDGAWTRVTESFID